MTNPSACLFCRIVNKEVPSAIVYEDKEFVAFKDAFPKAPIHVLIVPRNHLEQHLALKESDVQWLGKIHLLANRLAREEKVDQEGFRLIINCGQNGGQTVNHLHMHLMGGRNFTWPPG